MFIRGLSQISDYLKNAKFRITEIVKLHLRKMINDKYAYFLHLSTFLRRNIAFSCACWLLKNEATLPLKPVLK